MRENLAPSPLCQQSDIQVYRPPVSFFIQRIQQNDYFSFTRQMHGLWDAVIAAWILKPELRHIELDDEDYVQKLATSMSEAKKVIEDLYYEPSFYSDLLGILKKLDAKDSSFMFGVSDTYFFPDSPPPYFPEDFWLPDKCVFKLLPTKDNLRYYKLRFEDRQNVIKLLLPVSYPFFDAMIWKLYAYRNNIWDLFEAIESHPVVLVGPSYFENFGKLAKLPNYHHIKIHGTKASIDRDLIMDEIIQMHQGLSSTSKPPVYFFVAGSVSVYWVYHLHQKLENKFLIDVGQAFNFIYSSNSTLMHREFGYSQKAENGRRTYKTKKLYGQSSFQSSMRIVNDQVEFNLKPKFKEAWFEIILSTVSRRLINLYRVKRWFFKVKHHFYNFLRSG